MKPALFIMSLFIGLNSYSQKNDASVVLSVGQKFSVHTTVSQEADMGMGMQMKNNSTSQNNFYVIGADGKSYTISNTLTGIVISMDFMGQQTNYDSDKKEDSASEIGKSIPNLNIPDTVIINKFSAAIISNKQPVPATKEESSNPMEALFESLGNNNADMALSEAFFLIPAGKKTGDSWIDSTSTKDQKSIKTYTIKSIDKKIATIEVIGNVESNIQTETEGLQVTVSMVTKTNTEIIADTKTSLVIKRITNAVITGNLELMGQSAPITGKSTTSSVYEY
jgi:hypothetical protein